ncbi:MAG: primosomal protein N' [Burkholderiaceae bacterium]|nr:primosomal protein N' [Burkholderiaceae bacterium]
MIQSPDTPPGACHWLSIVVPTPAHSNVAQTLSYRSDRPVPAGALVRVPLGRREVLGVVWQNDAPAPVADLLPHIRPVAAVLDALAPLSAEWRKLIDFTARYYQRALGEVALAALPPQLRGLSQAQLARRLNRKTTPAAKASALPADGAAPSPPLPVLTEEQARALRAMAREAGTFLLHGATGSGKTEVYLRASADALAQNPQAQVLVLTPEINLTPQLLARFEARFVPLYGAEAVIAMHSALTPAQRLNSWLAAHTGRARIVLGTRMAVLASMPALALIVVDEEHDPSYKQQEGARYSARDLAVLRGHLAGAKVILGSATPSLESWHQSRPAADGDSGGRYRRLGMPRRVGAAGDGTGWPRVHCVDMNLQPRGTLIAAPLLDAIAQRVARGQQCLLLLNRRGYAPVLQCTDCGWNSACPHCSAFQVFHKADRTLRCHHCALSQPVPRACPECGNTDLGMLGQGTEQLEEHIVRLLGDITRSDGGAARVARIDADATRAQGALQSRMAAMHAGEVDVLVGTQMIAKGHDFRRVTLVAAINPDNALFSSDFRAPERLFALLMQAAGRAGRDAALGAASEMWVQTRQSAHPLLLALRAHDFDGFARHALAERQQAGLPPFVHLALLRAEARTQEAAQDFLRAASDTARAQLAEDAETARLLPRVTFYPAVPMAMPRVAGMERAQMLLESPSRAALQRVLAAWQPILHALRAQHRGIARWAVDVDPLAV